MNVDTPVLVGPVATHVPLVGHETAASPYELAGIASAVHVVPPSVVTAAALPTATHSVADTHETADSGPVRVLGSVWVVQEAPPSVDTRIPESLLAEFPPAKPVPTAKQSDAVGQLTPWRSTELPNPLGTVAAVHVPPPSALVAICPRATVTQSVAVGHDTAWA